jgi:hypothetical protein
VGKEKLAFRAFSRSGLDRASMADAAGTGLMVNIVLGTLRTGLERKDDEPMEGQFSSACDRRL